MKTTTTRPTRTPLANRNILTVKGEEAGFKYRIVNDTGNCLRIWVMKLFQTTLFK